jgi:hypothetical protein
MTVSRLGVGGCGPVVIKPAMGTSPLLDCGPFPDFAHVEHDLGSGEVVVGGQLLDTLPAHAEQAADLRRPHEVMPDSNHGQDATSHLTWGQEYGKLVT